MSQGQANPNYGLSPTGKQSLIFAGDYGAADEGSFYTSFLTSTASTAVALTTNTIAQANPVLAIQNQWTLTSGNNAMNMYLRYIKMLITVVPTSNTTVNYATTLDPMGVKLTTTGTALSAPVNVNGSSTTSSIAKLIGGVNVAAASSSLARQVGAGQITGAIPVAFDEYILNFGSFMGGGDLVGTQTLVKRINVQHAPVIIAPQEWFTLGLWGASWAASAFNVQLEVGWIERPGGQ
jgi:hypothetical protein